MTLLYFAPVPWDSYVQRPHYFVRHFLQQGGRRVVWIDPYPTRLPVPRDLQKIVTPSRLPLERPANLTVVGLRAIPLEPLGIGRWLNARFLWAALDRRLQSLGSDDELMIGIGRPSGLAAAALTAYRASWSFYDAMDDFPEFYRGISKRSVAGYERDIVRAVDAVITPSSALWTKFEAIGSRRIMIHNAFEMSALPPLPIARNGHPVFGYVGCIGSWFDWPTVVRVAAAHANAAVHVVGPAFERVPRNLPANVHVFPACPLAGAIGHFQTFSVGLIPFARTRLTEGVDPIKYYGYRAMGLPVLSTRFGEMTRRGVADGVFLVDEHADPGPIAAAALASSPDRSEVEQFRAEHTWERRFDDAGVFARV